MQHKLALLQKVPGNAPVCLLVHKQPPPALGHLEKVEGGCHILRIDNNFTFIGDVKKMHLPNVREGAFVPLNLAAHRI